MSIGIVLVCHTVALGVNFHLIYTTTFNNIIIHNFKNLQTQKYYETYSNETWYH